MSWHVTIRQAANADLLKARDWYEGRRQGLGNQFLASAERALASLEEIPERIPVY